MQVIVFVPGSGQFNPAELPCIAADGRRGDVRDVFANHDGNLEVMVVSPATDFEAEQYTDQPIATVEEQLGDRVHSVFDGHTGTCALTLDTNVVNELYQQYKGVITHFHNYPMAVKQNFQNEADTFIAVEEIFDIYFLVTVINGKISSYTTVPKNLNQALNQKIIAFYKERKGGEEGQIDRLFLGGSIELSEELENLLNRHEIATKRYQSFWEPALGTVAGTNRAAFETEFIRRALGQQQRRRTLKMTLMVIGLLTVLSAGAAGYFYVQAQNARKTLGDLKRQTVQQKDKLQQYFRASQLRQSSDQTGRYTDIWWVFSQTARRGLMLDDVTFKAQDGTFNGTAAMVEDESVTSVDERALLIMRQVGVTIEKINDDQDPPTVTFSGNVNELDLTGDRQ